MNIIVRSGLQEYLGKKVSTTNVPYVDGDTIICVQKKNFNYGKIMVAKDVAEWSDFTNWKKVETEKKFMVTVVRTSSSTREIAVKAIDVAAAKAIAIDLAGDFEFSEQNAEYTVEHVAIN